MNFRSQTFSKSTKRMFAAVVEFDISVALHDYIQGRRQNAGIVTHIKGNLLKQTVIFTNCVPLQTGNFALRAVPYGMKNTTVKPV